MACFGKRAVQEKVLSKGYFNSEKFMAVQKLELFPFPEHTKVEAKSSPLCKQHNGMMTGRSCHFLVCQRHPISLVNGRYRNSNSSFIQEPCFDVSYFIIMKQFQYCTTAQWANGLANITVCRYNQATSACLRMFIFCSVEIPMLWLSWCFARQCRQRCTQMYLLVLCLLWMLVFDSLQSNLDSNFQQKIWLAKEEKVKMERFAVERWDRNRALLHETYALLKHILTNKSLSMLSSKAATDSMKNS